MQELLNGFFNYTKQMNRHRFNARNKCLFDLRIYFKLNTSILSYFTDKIHKQNEFYRVTTFQLSKTMAHAMFYSTHLIPKPSKSSIKERQRAMTMDPPLTADGDSKPKQRSSSFSNAIHQVVGFVQRKLSRTGDEEKYELANTHTQEKD
jgi:hypothetical protein